MTVGCVWQGSSVGESARLIIVRSRVQAPLLLQKNLGFALLSQQSARPASSRCSRPVNSSSVAACLAQAICDRRRWPGLSRHSCREIRVRRWPCTPPARQRTVPARATTPCRSDGPDHVQRALPGPCRTAIVHAIPTRLHRRSIERVDVGSRPGLLGGTDFAWIARRRLDCHQPPDQRV